MGRAVLALLALCGAADGALRGAVAPRDADEQRAKSRRALEEVIEVVPAAEAAALAEQQAAAAAMAKAEAMMAAAKAVGAAWWDPATPEGVSEEQKTMAGQILSAVGLTFWFEEEKELDAVTAVSGQAMESQGISNMEQLSAKVPGLQIGRGAQTTNIRIRGVGSGINKGFEQSAGMYIDGIYQSRSRQFTQSLVDLQQVEVLRNG